MTKRWIDRGTNQEAIQGASDFWASMRLTVAGGRFWADQVKYYRGEPAKALETALDQLPLPAAFRASAIATRALIREKRKRNELAETELKLLYSLAAIRSFMLDYAPRLKEPGFNVVESVPGLYLRSLSYKYSELGYRDLALLGKTDVKWIVEVWGEPDAHTTLNALYRNVWEEYETRLIARRKAERASLFGRM